MLCQKCHKNPASVRYTEVVDGQAVHQFLCPSCLAGYQENAAAAFNLDVPKPGLRRGKDTDSVRFGKRARRACPTCGMPLDRILETARVGCADCYSHFGEEVESILEGLHRSPKHQGKARRTDDARARLRADLQKKRVLLRSVLQVEDYEQAASLRDEIKRLETGLHLSEAGRD